MKFKRDFFFFQMNNNNNQPVKYYIILYCKKVYGVEFKIGFDTHTAEKKEKKNYNLKEYMYKTESIDGIDIILQRAAEKKNNSTIV